MINHLPASRELQSSLRSKTIAQMLKTLPHQPVLLIVANREKQLSLDKKGDRIHIPND